jgi:hypothetical protein
MYRNQDLELKIVTQHPNYISFHHLKEEQEEEDDNHSEHSHESGSGEENEEDHGDSHKDEETEGEVSDEEEEPDFAYAAAPIIQDEKGVIYYLTKYEGQVSIMEINPKSDEIHENIFEIKSDFCLGFCYNNGYFYLMDTHKVVN